MLLLALAILRDDLVTDWRASLPVDVPEYFFVNIPADARADFQHELQSQERAPDTPAADDPRPAAEHQRPAAPPRLHFPGVRGRGFADREQNLTWAAEPGDDNRIVEGQWWSARPVRASRWCR